MSLQLRRTNLDRETPFAFSCMRCLACCRNKKIQINPYEIARLARNRRLSTADFLDRYTTEGGTFLTWDAEGTCVFLDSQGCSVHEDRPLVCRLYPLGRHVRNTMEESLSEIEPDPECQGIYGKDGKIRDYLESQGALPFMAAADRYLSLFWKLYDVLQKDAIEPANRIAVVNVFTGSSATAAEQYDILKDVDTAVTEYCKKTNSPFPNDIEEKISIHIRAIEAWANSSTGGEYEKAK